jgi:hypothetical protein
VALAGELFKESIKLQINDELTGAKFSTSAPITVTASANVLTLNGVLLTQSYTVNSVDGIVDFVGLGFSNGVTGPVTLTFTSDAFVGTSLVVTPTYFPANVEINASGVTNGTFFEGEFFATSNTGVTNINKDVLTSHMASFSTVISASGYISVNSSFTSATSSDIVLRARGFVNVTANQTVRTHGGDIVLWANSDQTAGGVVRLLGGSQLCTAPSGGTCGTTSTGGGDVVIGGGAALAGNPLRPGGFALGSSATATTDATNATTGVQIGTYNSANAGASIYSAGGNIQVSGQLAPGVQVAGQGVEVVGGSVIDSGAGKISIVGSTI